jgi:16S rRNA C1402 (ribose-2'-O) methylase RsmI
MMKADGQPVRGGEASRGPCLYVVATPIGNLEDITLRALRVLKEVDLIACEDTRQTRKLLDHYGIQTRMISYHEHNEMTRAAELIVNLEQGGRLALVSDAGMPSISDPGHRLITLAIRHHVPVIPVPGASAFVAALVASGLPTDSFKFNGFLPAKRGQRRNELEKVRDASRTVIYYEAPHRISAEAQRHLLANIEKARELGAIVVRLQSTHPVPALLDYARSHAVGHVMIGRSHRPWWQQVLGRSFVARMVKEAAGFDLHIVALDDEEERA